MATVVVAAALLGTVWTAPAWAITASAPTISGRGGDLGPLTMSCTVGAGGDRVLVVGVTWKLASGATADVSSITYGGTALNRIAGACPGATRDGTALYYLDMASDSSGTTANIIVTMTTPTGSGMNVGAMTLSGAKQGGPTTSSKNNSGGTSVTTISLSPAMNLQGGMAVVDVVSNSSTAYSTLTPPTGSADWISPSGSYNHRGAGTFRVLGADNANYLDTWTAGTSARMSLSAAAWESVAPLIRSVTSTTRNTSPVCRNCVVS